MTEKTLQEPQAVVPEVSEKSAVPAEQVVPQEVPAEVSIGEKVAEAAEAVVEKVEAVAKEIVEKVEEAVGAGEPAAAAPEATGEPKPHVATPIEQVGTQISDVVGQMKDGFVSAGKGLQRQFDQPLKQLGDFAGKTLEQVQDYVKNDLPKVGEQASERFPAERLQAGGLSLLAKGVASLGGLLQGWSRKLEQVVTIEAGQETGPCTLTCTKCGNVAHLEHASAVVPCLQCQGTTFRKSY
ncbi:MAG: hypothetical protein WBP72_01435 [Rhodocyclaceae bacterium]